MTGDPTLNSYQGQPDRLPRKLCMLWSGGKDSFTAYSMASTALGTSPSDWLFVTFVPSSGVFHCHPLGLLERQSSALGVEHIFATVDKRDWATSYFRSFMCLRRHWAVERVFTGDILFGMSSVEGYWLLRMLEDVGMEMALPLCGMYAGPLFDRMAEYGIDAVITGVADWVDRPDLLGSQISLELLHSSGLYLDPYVDLAGEQGEYHTSVVAAGGLHFLSSIDILSSGRVMRTGGVDVPVMDPSLLALSSPRMDLANDGN